MRNFKAYVVAIFSIIVPCLVPLNAHAVMLNIIPASQSVDVGNTVTLELQISGLGEFTSPSLSVYDIDVLFDSSLLSFEDAVFGDPVLGNQLDLFGFGSINSATPIGGGVNLFELSLDLPDDLDTLQASEFTLATLDFQSVGAGLGLFSLSVNELGDSFGDSMAFDYGGDAEFRIANSNTVVPEPVTAVMFSAGLLSGAYFRQRKS